MVRWAKSKLWGIVIACSMLVGASTAYGLTLPSCKAAAINACALQCGDNGQCIFGCLVGQDYSVDRCHSDCNGFSPLCLSSCLDTVNAITLCSTFTIGGTASGLGVGKSAVLQNNAGDNLTVSSNGSFTFATSINGGSNYAVTVLTQPTGQTCAVGSDSGTANADVSNVTLTCSTPVPTLSEWAMITFAMLIAGFGIYQQRRRQS